MGEVLYIFDWLNFLGDRTNERLVNPLYHLFSGTKYNGQKYDIMDTCCKMLDACVICVVEGHWRV